MKIAHVRPTILSVDLPDREVFAYSQAWFLRRRSLVVEIETADGTVGYGEAFGPPATNAALVDEVYAPLLLGRDALDRETRWLELYTAMRDHGRKGTALEALSAVDIALWDLAGKHFGVPCHRLAGRTFRRHVAAYATGFYRKRAAGGLTGQAPLLVEEALGYVEAGFTALKVKIGFGIDDDVTVVNAVRDAVGPDVRIMVDANHAYDRAAALEVARRILPAGIDWFEEPLIPEDLRGLGRFRRESPIPISTGEAEFGRWGFADLLRHEAADIVQPDCCAAGGITETLKIADLADAAHVRCIPHVWGTGIAVAASLQVLAMIAPCPPALIPREPLLELDRTCNPLREELNLTPPAVGPGMAFTIPTAPGIGVEPDRRVLERYRATS
jgi:D-galactarolactone cycloisomerase